MIKVYPIEVIGVDTEDDGRTLFALRTFDNACATLKIDTLVSPGIIKQFLQAIHEALDCLELDQDSDQ